MTEKEYLDRGYRLDDLQTHGLAVLQHPNEYCFTTDPVLLAHFCKVTRKTRAVDLGSGCGILGTLLVGKYGAASCDGVEIRASAVGMSEASAARNGLSDRLKFYHMRIQDAPAVLGSGGYDLTVSNPPYTRVTDGAKNEAHDIAVARHEVELTLDELVAAAAKLTKYGGRFCVVHQAERLADLCATLTRYGFAPKRIRLVEGRTGLAPTLVLLDALKGGGVGLHFYPNLTLYNRDDTETAELAQIYNREVKTK